MCKLNFVCIDFELCFILIYIELQASHQMRPIDNFKLKGFFKVLCQVEFGKGNKFHIFSCFSLFYKNNKNIHSKYFLSLNVD